jgi:hypothetical protein
MPLPLYGQSLFGQRARALGVPRDGLAVRHASMSYCTQAGVGGYLTLNCAACAGGGIR